MCTLSSNLPPTQNHATTEESWKLSCHALEIAERYEADLEDFIDQELSRVPGQSLVVLRETVATRHNYHL